MIKIGMMLGDRYEILEKIGTGGMSDVYKAKDHKLNRFVAVRVLKQEFSENTNFVSKFRVEAQAAASLMHPNIVNVYDVGEENGVHYIVMELVEGITLKKYIEKKARLSVKEAVSIAIQACMGLEAAHNNHIIHRDIKPQNIIISKEGKVKVTDFGIAKAATSNTITSNVMGSVHYTSPEQARGGYSDERSDIYSMGIVMYELLTGKLPYKGDNAVEIALKHLKEPLPSIREELPNIPQSVENIIIKATAKNPKNRYADAREMHNDLLTCLDESRINEPKIKLPYREFSESDKPKAPKKETEEEKKTETKKSEKESKDDEVLAKQITKNDLKKQNKVLIVLASIFTLLVVAITTVILLIPALTSNKEITVPDVTGYSVEDALKTLQDAGFTVASEQQQTASTEIEVGKVVRTSPLANTKRTEGTEVTLWVSSGDPSITLEDYTGKNYLEVQGALKALGVQVIVEKRNVDIEKYEENAVIEQSPKAGEKVAEGDYVTLYIPNYDVYPDFTTGNYTYDDVVEYLKDYNCLLYTSDAADEL